MTTLSAVKDYMQHHRRASVEDLAVGLSSSPDVVHHLLEMWRAKQRVRIVAAADACNGCGKGLLQACACPAETYSSGIYEWVDKDMGSAP
ncbi:FeoC-like transcriptional regulator [Xanthobacter autotrophicus]|uniref:FeoC-like transcriptional regulator n=1 Tax=Xanthobacter autotrophicus TaxID=280 RepID=UPI00372B5FF6